MGSDLNRQRRRDLPQRSCSGFWTNDDDEGGAGFSSGIAHATHSQDPTEDERLCQCQSFRWRGGFVPQGYYNAGGSRHGAASQRGQQEMQERPMKAQRFALGHRMQEGVAMSSERAAASAPFGVGSISAISDVHMMALIRNSMAVFAAEKSTSKRILCSTWRLLAKLGT